MNTRRDNRNVAEGAATVATVATPSDLRWCILRTAGSRTLPLARSLAEAGVNAWTPTAIADRRRGRSRVRVEAEAAILPTFVFAPANLVDALLDLESAPTSPHPSFSLFRHNGRVALVAAAEWLAVAASELAGYRRLSVEAALSDARQRCTYHGQIIPHVIKYMEDANPWRLGKPPRLPPGQDQHRRPEAPLPHMEGETR